MAIGFDRSSVPTMDIVSAASTNQVILAELSISRLLGYILGSRKLSKISLLNIKFEEFFEGGESLVQRGNAAPRKAIL